MEYRDQATGLAQFPTKDQIKKQAAERERRLIKYIKIDLTAEPQPLATCAICKATILMPNSDQFIPYTVLVDNVAGKARTKFLKTNKEALKWFQEAHWIKCIRFYREG